MLRKMMEQAGVEQRIRGETRSVPERGEISEKFFLRGKA